jgi:hypothetical protein
MPYNTNATHVYRASTETWFCAFGVKLLIIRMVL